MSLLRSIAVILGAAALGIRAASNSTTTLSTVSTTTLTVRPGTTTTLKTVTSTTSRSVQTTTTSIFIPTTRPSTTTTTTTTTTRSTYTGPCAATGTNVVNNWSFECEGAAWRLYEGAKYFTNPGVAADGNRWLWLDGRDTDSLAVQHLNVDPGVYTFKFAYRVQDLDTTPGVCILNGAINDDLAWTLQVMKTVPVWTEFESTYNHPGGEMQVQFMQSCVGSYWVIGAIDAVQIYKSG